MEVLLEWDPARPPLCRNDNINSSSGSCCSNAAGGGGGGGTSPESRGGIKSASLRQKLISFCVTFGGDNGESVARMRQYQSPVDKHAHTDTHTIVCVVMLLGGRGEQGGGRRAEASRACSAVSAGSSQLVFFYRGPLCKTRYPEN